MKIAFLINKQKIISQDVLHLCEKMATRENVFFGEKASKSITNLGIDCDIDINRYEYIVYCNPWDWMSFEDKSMLCQRQNYYIFPLLTCEIEKIIAVLERNKYVGMLVPSTDCYKVFNQEYYSKWSDFFDSMSCIFSKNNVSVPLSREKQPLTLDYGCAVIKTKALKDISKIKIDCYSPEFLSFFLPLFIQKNIFLPAYYQVNGIYQANYYGNMELSVYKEIIRHR